MNIKSSVNRKGRAVVTVTGNFNIESVTLFEDTMNSVFSEKINTVIIDFEGLMRIDSSGIGSLIKAYNIAKNEGIDFFLCNPSKGIQNVLSVSFLDRFFAIRTATELRKTYPDIEL
jgi:anti-sigma B factor antagonist